MMEAIYGALKIDLRPEPLKLSTRITPGRALADRLLAGGAGTAIPMFQSNEMAGVIALLMGWPLPSE
jgi:hypothetical protein